MKHTAYRVLNPTFSLGLTRTTGRYPAAVVIALRSCIIKFHDCEIENLNIIKKQITFYSLVPDINDTVSHSILRSH